MTILRRLLGFAVVLTFGSGCATNLVVHEVPVLPDSPPGIVVNKRIVYAVSVTIVSGLGIVPAPAEKAVVAVDQHRMLALNICRQPFANGKLSLELTKAQTLKNVALTSESGAARSLDAGKAIVEAAKPKQEEAAKADEGGEN